MPLKLKIATSWACLLLTLILICAICIFLQKLFISRLVYQTPEKIQHNQSIRELVLNVTPSQSAADDFTIYLQNQEDLKTRSNKVSPDGKKSAYLQDKFVTKIEDEGDSDYTSLVMVVGNKTQTIFQNDYHLSHFEWLDNRKIAVYRSCGTECMIAYLVDTQTKKYQKVTLGGDYSWSPNQQYVLAYHFVPRYGILVAGKSDGYQNTLLYLSRTYPEIDSALLGQTQVAWSSNSTKLALVIRKENEEKLELLIFDTTKQFNVLYQQDLSGRQITKLAWAGSHALTLSEDGAAKKITF